MKRLFGTDGVRGVANIDLTPEMAFRIGRITAAILSRQELPAKIVVGRDTRLSGEMLENALIAGILSSGVDVVQVGIMTTPGVSFLTTHLHAVGGIMVSASHNPFQDNGIKIFGANGYKLSQVYEAKIEEFLHMADDQLPRPSDDSLGRILKNVDAGEAYIDHLRTKLETDLCGLHIVVDCAHGAAFKLAPLLLRDLGADVTALNVSPNGTNINDRCGSMHPEQLQEEVLRKNADLGIAFDGDADRLVAVDEKGLLIDGDQIIYICAKYLKEKNMLKENTVVTTVMSNLGLIEALQKVDIHCKQTPVGDRYVSEEMMIGGYSLGGEQSGHVIFMDHSTTGDGILTAIQLFGIVKETGQTLNQLSQEMIKKPQYLLNVPVSSKEGWNKSEEINAIIEEVKQEIGNLGRVFVRSSGTEKILRIMLEGDNKEKLVLYANKIADVIRANIGEGV